MTPSTLAYKIDILVIGGGQAGLSSAYHLQRLGLTGGKGFLVLDKSPRPGGAWQFRWPSLTMKTIKEATSVSVESCSLTR